MCIRDSYDDDAILVVLDDATYYTSSFDVNNHYEDNIRTVSYTHLTDTHTHLVQFAVHFQSLHTLSYHASALGVPPVSYTHLVSMMAARVAGVPIPLSFIAWRIVSPSISLPAVSIAASNVDSVCNGFGLVLPSVMVQPEKVTCSNESISVSYTHLDVYKRQVRDSLRQRTKSSRRNRAPRNRSQRERQEA